jgi:hypothetical protein
MRVCGEGGLYLGMAPLSEDHCLLSDITTCKAGTKGTWELSPSQDF